MKITVALYFIRETEAAIRCSPYPKDESKSFWLPKSRVDYCPNPLRGDRINVLIPKWLADEKEIDS